MFKKLNLYHALLQPNRKNLGSRYRQKRVFLQQKVLEVAEQTQK